LLSNNFKVNIETEKFWFQYKYRHTSISYIFYKDLLSATGMMILFQYINLWYLSMFKQSAFNTADGEIAQKEIIAHNIKLYGRINYLGTLFSGALFMHLIAKVIYNLVA